MNMYKNYRYLNNWLTRIYDILWYVLKGWINQVKRFLKRCVFKFRLKISRLFDFRISKGNLFHKKGAHILKARHPYVLFVTFVSFLCKKSRSGLADRRPVLPGTYKSIKRVKYIGAWLFKILYTNINNLKTILSRRRSHIRDRVLLLCRSNIKIVFDAGLDLQHTLLWKWQSLVCVTNEAMPWVIMPLSHDRIFASVRRRMGNVG